MKANVTNRRHIELPPLPLPSPSHQPDRATRNRRRGRRLTSDTAFRNRQQPQGSRTDVTTSGSQQRVQPARARVAPFFDRRFAFIVVFVLALHCSLCQGIFPRSHILLEGTKDGRILRAPSRFDSGWLLEDEQRTHQLAITNLGSASRERSSNILSAWEEAMEPREANLDQVVEINLSERTKFSDRNATGTCSDWCSSPLNATSS